MKSFVLRYWPYFGLALVLLLAFALRVIPLEARDFWYDEAFTGIVVRQSWSQMMDSIIHDVHPPLYYLVLKLWATIFGYGPTALRAFSVTCGLAMIAGVAALLRAWHKDSWWPSFAVASMFAVDPFFVNYNQEARMYAFFSLLLVMSIALLRRSWKRETIGARQAFGFSLLLLCLTHYLGAVFSLGFLLVDLHHDRVWRLSSLKKKLRWFVDGYAVAFLGGLCWLPFFLMQASHHATLGWVPAVPFSALATSLHIFLFGAPVGVAGVPPALTYAVDGLKVADVTLALVIATVVLATWLTAKKRWNMYTGLTGFMTVFPLLMTWLAQLGGQKLYVERFLTGAGVFFILFLVTSLYRTHKYALAASLAAYVVLVSLIQPWTYTTPFVSMDAVLSAQSQTTVIFTNPFDYTIGRYYTEDDHAVKLFNEDHPGEVISGWVVVPEDQQVAELPAASEDYLLVTQHPEKYPDATVVSTIENFTILSM